MREKHEGFMQAKMQRLYKKEDIIVNLPLFEKIKGNEYSETIINLYQNLKKQIQNKEKNLILNPSKIKMNKEDLNSYIKMDINNMDDGNKTGLAWMNQGPSVGENVPKGKVRLLKDWITK